MRPVLILFAAFAAALASAQAGADTIYKWVDASGSVHYSNSPPDDPTRKPEVVVQDKISTYQSDPPALRGQAETEYLARRVDSLERQLVAEREAARYAEARQAGYDQGPGYAPYPYAVVAGRLITARRFPVRNVHVHSIRPAGHVIRTSTAPRMGRSFR
jgi:hypothetical protein